ncbi:MAG: glycogen synthase GlgA [Alphaproteobacteria bacterium]|nr:MAG: glycogen synthase GlgA [Alphaproteobacteria bacterium]
MSSAGARTVLSVASEAFPLIKTGGLADVAGALPGALAPLGVDMRTLLPGYPAVMDALAKAKTVHRWRALFGGPASLVAANVESLDLLVLDAPHLYARPGNPYVDADGQDWPDNAERFAALAFVGAQIGHGLLPDYAPDVVHAHDWQAGLVPAYMRFAAPAKAATPPATVVTIHNLAFQGQFPPDLLAKLHLPAESFTMDGVEYYGQIGFLKAGLAMADHITTVSPTYAVEIQGSEMGMGLDGLLRYRGDSLSGILNGIDIAVWDPAGDPHLAAPYTARRLAARKRNKAAIRQRFALAEDDAAPLFTVISRLTWQKGMDLLLAALPRLLSEGGQLALLGAGDATLEAQFAAAASSHPGRIGVVLGYDESLSHLLQGGADAILVPSRFEPCGLTQLYGLRYGTVPVVARVGGLADTVIDANDAALAAGVATGFQFAPVTVDALCMALTRAARCYRQPAVWRSLQRRGMASDVGWHRPATQYAALYEALAAKRRQRGKA